MSQVLSGAAQERPSEPKRWLLTYKDVSNGHDWAVDNPHVTAHYRQPGSWRLAAQSLCKCHNETVNVYSHLFGAIFFLWLFIGVLWAHERSHPKTLCTAHPTEAFLHRGMHTAALYRLVASHRIPYTSHLVSMRTPSPIAVLLAQARDSIQLSWGSMSTGPEPVWTHLHGRVTDALVATLSQARNAEERAVEVLRAAERTVASALYGEEGSAQQVVVSQRKLLNKWLSKAKELGDEVRHGPLPGRVSRVPLMAFMLSAVICLSFSAIFHLMFISSKRMWLLLSKLDYVGIIILIAGSTEAALYYLLYCHSTLQQVYMWCAAVANMAMLAVVVSPALQNRPALRTTAFVGVSVIGGAGMVHAFFLPESSSAAFWNFAETLSWMGLAYLSGAILYVFRMPEQFFPGAFNLFGASHQLFHIAVFIGAWVHHQGVRDFMHALEAGETACLA